MHQQTFGQRLQAARKAAGYRTQAVLADLVGVSDKTIRNYETDKTEPDYATKQKLRALLGPFDAEGDPVEAAVRQSRLTEDRQHVVLGVYKRQLREQDEEEGGRRGA